MNPYNWEGVFERRTSIGSEAFYLLNFTFIEPICPKIWTKQLPKNARRNFTFDCRPSLKNAFKVSNVPYINCLHYQKSESENLIASFLFEFIIQWYASLL